MREFNQTVLNARRQLETLSTDASDDVTVFVTEIQEMKRSLKGWEIEMDRFKSGQKLLQTQRFQFPSDWLWIDIVEGEWSAFKQILSKKVQLMDEQIPTLQAKILEEEKIASTKIQTIEEDWKNKRPNEASVAPQVAIDQLGILGKRIEGAKNEWTRIYKAKELLDMDMELADPRRLDNLEEDYLNLKGVWQEVAKVWVTVEAINDTPFSAY